MWSISVRTVMTPRYRPVDAPGPWTAVGVASVGRGSGVATEERDLGEQLGASFRVGDTQALFGREAQDAELAFVAVVVHLVRRGAGLLEREHLRERGLDLAVADQLVGGPRLAVVGEVAALQRLEVHPQ